MRFPFFRGALLAGPGMRPVIGFYIFQYFHLREVGVPSRNILHVRPVGLLTGIGVARPRGAESACGVCKKHRIVYDTAILATLRDRPLAAAGRRPVIGFHMFHNFYSNS